ncbi:MAG: hypothetical protein HY518_01270 [Candidatus Aenigmarchaeota archaeon]|nr:hypothetical protein [Candidatus Aenigmarchaeota archaeon]
MDARELKTLIQCIVEMACELKNKYTTEKKASVNYACLFSKNNREYSDLLQAAKRLGEIIKETPTGPVFLITSLDTVSGKLRLLKIRLPDKARPERGDADFTASNYHEFKKKHLSRKGFKLIQRENFEMIELMENGCNVRVYFSHPTLEKQLGLR